MKGIKYFFAIIIGVIILSFYLPYCYGNGDKILRDRYNIWGAGAIWKKMIIWGIVIFGGMFVYTVFNEEDKKK